MGLSIPHLTVVLAIVILVFGTKHLRSLGGDLGSAIKSFRNAINDEDDSQTTIATQSELQDTADLGKKA